MGQHVWLMCATVITELLIIIKFGRGQFVQPFPILVKLFAATGAVLLISYPIHKVWKPQLLANTRSISWCAVRPPDSPGRNCSAKFAPGHSEETVAFKLLKIDMIAL